MKVAVIGAGPAGITAALSLSRSGAQVDVYEASGAAGGMARTIELWGQRVDIGPHRFFSQDSRVNDVWFELAGQDHVLVDRLTRIFYGGQLYHYPLKGLDVLKKLGPVEATRASVSYAAERLRPSATRDGSFEQWVVQRFGRRLFEIFFKTYSEKLWGISCSDLDADFAAQRIRGLSMVEAVRSMLSASARAKHRTLLERFAYPRDGSGVVYERMADEVRTRGGRVLLNTPIEGLVQRGREIRGVRLQGGEAAAYDHVISTMPLTRLVAGLEGVSDEVRAAADRLKFRNTIVVYVQVDRPDLFGDQWIYVHAPELKFGRVTNFRNWSPHLMRGREETILALEYWCNDADAIWSETDAQLCTRARWEIERSGLLGRGRVLDASVYRIHRCYPVYGRGYREHLSKVVSHLRSVEGLTPIGRYGAFKYNNQDHSILMGLLAAENLMKGAAHDLWSVNTDYESYQESGPAPDAKGAAA